MEDTTDLHTADSSEVPVAAYKPGFIDSNKFARAKFTPSWLVENVFVYGEPGVIGGPKKSMKTSVMLDLAISIGTGTPFLGSFAVPCTRRVAVISGESAPATLQETALRIAKSKKVDLRAAYASWSIRLPRLNHAGDRRILADWLRQNGIQVVFIDPLYLCLLGGSTNVSASNLYEIGPLLAEAAKSCLAAGATPILIHHAVKAKPTKNNRYQPLELDDLAFSGIGEFARQWLLLKRTEPYGPGRSAHKLLMSAGGSAGHCGSWQVSINDGVMASDFTGRTWRVQVTEFVDQDDDESEDEYSTNDRTRSRSNVSRGDQRSPGGK